MNEQLGLEKYTLQNHYLKFIIKILIFIIFIKCGTIKFNLINNRIISKRIQQKKLNYNNIFVIVREDTCKICGLMAYYKHYLASVSTYIREGYIPIIDLKSFPNILNGYKVDSMNKNPWEIFFNQPFGYELDNVLKNGKFIRYAKCNFRRKIIPYYIFLNETLINYWHIIATNYIPIKKEIYRESLKIMNILFKRSDNILGILIRGTDYLAKKPKKHPITPDSNIVIDDVKMMDKINNYDYYFIATEDDIIRNKFIDEFGKKLKFIKQKKMKYRKKYYLSYYKSFRGNIENIKIYLLNIIILSKCLDIIASRTSGSIIAFIFSNGFRNSKIYFLGEYN